jgi:hypothetical protein
METWATYNLRAKLRGDSWKGLPLIRIRVNGAAPAQPVASAKIQFKKREDDVTAAYELKTTDGSILITDAAEWEFQVPPVLEFPLAAGVWYYSFKTVSTTGFKRTYFKGTMTIARTPTD